MRFIIFFLFLLPLKIYAQDITGIWIGTIYNDTTHKYIPYEIAVSENKSKFTGFSHSTFIEEDGKKIAVKSINIKIKDKKYFVEDEQWVYKNYPEPAPKGVKQHSELSLIINDSGMVLIGPFNTTRTKEYLSNTGTIHLTKKSNFKQSEIIPKLNELDLSKNLSFLQPGINNEIAKVQVNENKSIVFNQQKEKEKKIDSTVIQSYAKEKDIATSLPKQENKFPVAIFKEKEIVSNEPVLSKEISKVAIDKVVEKQTELKEPVKKHEPIIQPKNKGVAILFPDQKNKLPVASQPREKIVSASVSKEDKKSVSIPIKEGKKNVAIVNQPKQKSEPVSQLKVDTKNLAVEVAKEEKKLPTSVSQSKDKEIKIVTTSFPQSAPKSVSSLASAISAEDLAKRKIETIKSVYFKTDSITLTLYDNGEVDGDVVSVLLNGNVIMPKVALSTSAIKKTIYITPDMGDSLQLIMYAENLGSIPPNTGLLILQDGDDRYEIRFAGDLQKNSAIILRRKKSMDQ